MNLLREFFANKDSIDFRFGLPGNGTMTYSSSGKRESTQVDVWLKRDQGEIGVYALNISNYPIATVFFNVHQDTSKTEK
jgi:ribosomal protein S9